MEIEPNDKGNPIMLLPQIFNSWNISSLYHEIDTEPFWQVRDAKIEKIAKENGVCVIASYGHTLFDPIATVKKNNGKVFLNEDNSRHP